MKATKGEVERLALICEVERLALICEALQFGTRPDCPDCMADGKKYNPQTRNWTCDNQACPEGWALVNPRTRWARDLRVLCPPLFRSMSQSGGYVAEHRLIAAQCMGRALTSEETVHHVNKDYQDNRPENLMVFACYRDYDVYKRHGTPGPLWRGGHSPTTATAALDVQDLERVG